MTVTVVGAIAATQIVAEVTETETETTAVTVIDGMTLAILEILEILVVSEVTVARLPNVGTMAIASVDRDAKTSCDDCCLRS